MNYIEYINSIMVYRREVTRFLIYYSLYHCFLTLASAYSASNSRVKLYYHNKKFDSEIYIEAKDSVIFFCPSKVSIEQASDQASMK